MQFQPRSFGWVICCALDRLGRETKAQTELEYLEIETSAKSKLNKILSPFNQRHCREEPELEFEDECIVEEEEEGDAPTQFLQTQKKQLFGLQDHLERYCIVFWVFGFNGEKYDINLLKSYLLPLLVNERGIEPLVIKKANQFVSFEFGDVQLLDIMNILGGATKFDFFWKLTRLQRGKIIFHMNGSKIQKTSTILNFLYTKSSVANCATTSPSKKTIQTFKD